MSEEEALETVKTVKTVKIIEETSVSNPNDPSPSATGETDAQVRALLARASLLKMRGMNTEALATCEEALAKAPESIATYAVMGDIHERAGRYTEAIACYKEVVQRDSTRVIEKAKCERLLKIQTATQASPQGLSSPSPLAPQSKREQNKRASDNKQEQENEQENEGESPHNSEGDIARLLYICSGILGLLVLLTGSYLLWQNKQKTQLPQAQSTPPAQNTPQTQSTPQAGVPSPQASPTTAPSTPVPASSPAAPDWTKNFETLLPSDTRLVQITYNPKTGEVLIRLATPSRGNTETASQVQDRLLSLAAIIMKSVLQVRSSPTSVRLWIDMPPFDPATPVLSAEGNPQVFRSIVPGQTSSAEIAAAFTRVQWAAALVEEPVLVLPDSVPTPDNPPTPLPDTPPATPDMGNNNPL